MNLSYGDGLGVKEGGGIGDGDRFGESLGKGDGLSDGDGLGLLLGDGEGEAKGLHTRTQNAG